MADKRLERKLKLVNSIVQFDDWPETEQELSDFLANLRQRDSITYDIVLASIELDLLEHPYSDDDTNVPEKEERSYCHYCGGIGEFQGKTCFRCNGTGYEPPREDDEE